MVKRLCVLYPDGALDLMTNQDGEAVATNKARSLCRLYNDGETDPLDLAQFGEIEVDLQSFKLLR